MVALSLIISFFGLAFLGAIWRGYAFSILWGWFIVPIFGLPVLSIPLAIGLSMVVSFLTYQFIHTVDDRSVKDKAIEGISLGILHPAFALFFGWIVTLFL